MKLFIKKLFTKKEKVEKEPQYYQSGINLPVLNYKVYYMGKVEYILTFLVTFLVGAVVGYLFYGGIGKDEYGMPTTITYILNIAIPGITGIFAAKFLMPMRNQQLLKKRKKKIAGQFRDMLDGLTTSLGAGNNIIDSFQGVLKDMKIQYEEDALIIQELENIIGCIRNNVPIEDTLLDFGNRTGIDDIISFANVFKICYRKGGNMQEIIRNTHSILSDKMEISEDIETIVTASKTEQNLMIVMPILLIGVIKMMSPDFAENFVTLTGIIATSIGVGCFIGAYFIGKEVLDIKI